MPSKRKAESSGEDDDSVNDAELARKLQDAEKRPRRRVAKPAKKVATKKPRAGTSSYSRPCQLSPQLSEIMGTDKVCRRPVFQI